MGQIKLISDQSTGIITVILRQLLSAADIERFLPAIREAKASARLRRPELRILLIANSDPESGCSLAERLTGLKPNRDRLALVAGVATTRTRATELTEDLPVRVFANTREATAWLRGIS